jgi:hypothetical protein
MPWFGTLKMFAMHTRSINAKEPVGLHIVQHNKAKKHRIAENDLKREIVPAVLRWLSTTGTKAGIHTYRVNLERMIMQM